MDVESTENVNLDGIANSAVSLGVTSAAPNGDGNDDFGNFSDTVALPPRCAPGASNGSDPITKLVNLNGLIDNPKKEKNHLAEPVAAAPAAMQYLQFQNAAINVGGGGGLSCGRRGRG